MKKVAIIGCGKTGRGWAMLFAGSGIQVSIYDKNEDQVKDGLVDMRSQLDQLKKSGLLRGNLSVEQQISLIKETSDIKSCVIDADYIQECVFEDVELKRLVNSEIDRHMTDQSILASSTSYIKPNLISENLKHKNRFIIAHPTNPPYYVPLVELVPVEYTDGDVLLETRDLMKRIGQIPVTIKKYTDGYVRNRLQNVIFKESFDLFEKGIMSATDIDLVMTEGLGRRYAFMGVLETAYLNAHGFNEYSDKYSDVTQEVQATLGPPPLFTDEYLLEKVQKEMIQKTPLEKLNERYKWRAARTAELSKLIKDLDDESN